MDQEKRLILAPAPWALRFDALLAPAMRCDAGATVATLRADVEAGRATLFQILTEAGELVGAVVLRAERRECGADGVIDAAATTAPWVWRYMPALLAELERKFIGVDRARIHTRSRSLARRLSRESGYRLRELVLEKVLA